MELVHDEAKEITRKLLYLGAGSERGNPSPQHFPSYEVVTLDINPDSKPDLLMDMRDLKSLPASSFDGVVGSHSLEHVYFHEVPDVLSGVFHVLKRGGRVVQATPNLMRAAKMLVEHDYQAPIYLSPAGPIMALDLIYGHRGYVSAGHTFMAHKCGFTPRMLKDLLEQVGFVRVQVDEGVATSVDMTATGVKP